MKTVSSCSLGNDIRGVALVEFAIVLPILVLLLLGGFTFANAMAFNRKLASATRAVVDLTAQRASVDRSILETIASVRTPIMAPFALPAGTARISEIRTDGSNNATVTWSYASEGNALIKGAAFDLPSDIRIPNGAYLISELQYAFTPIVKYAPFVTLPLGERVIMVPRKSSDVPCSDC